MFSMLCSEAEVILCGRSLHKLSMTIDLFHANSWLRNGTNTASHTPDITSPIAICPTFRSKRNLPSLSKFGDLC
jgi:hypothetical protein